MKFTEFVLKVFLTLIFSISAVMFLSADMFVIAPVDSQEEVTGNNTYIYAMSPFVYDEKAYEDFIYDDFTYEYGTYDEFSTDDISDASDVSDISDISDASEEDVENELSSKTPAVSKSSSAQSSVNSQTSRKQSSVNSKTSKNPKTSINLKSSANPKPSAKSKSSASSKISKSSKSFASSKSKISKSSASSKPVSKNDVLGVTVKGKRVEMDAIEVISIFTTYEMSPSFHDEAIKAQAVASATFVAYNNSKNIYPTLPNKTPDSKITQIVKGVYKKRIYHNNQLINATYGASSAGYTRSSQEVWGGSLPYLVSVRSKYDNRDPNWDVKRTFTAAEIQKLIKDNLKIELEDDPKTWFTIVSKTKTGYVEKVRIGKNKTVSGHQFRELAMSRNGSRLIRSSHFTISTTKNSITFTTRGYGHGVGMSQNGANLYAKLDGMKYDRILRHYYTGVIIK